ncbi:unnamed protein product [Symbiodinium natans]|uniref:Fe2OG dioxygenase domain-containing protein n=1 Tax=Symbiodinium natans TaxID=878477 RepID=A0A812IHL2_9DINO|nr:unnamed protein product [Symbiodinium natans]
MVAEMLQLEAATQPDLYFQGDFLDNQDFDAMGSSLDSFGIQGGSTVRVRGTSELPLLWKGRGAMTSRRSEFLESNAALCLIDQCQAGQLLAWFEDMEPSTPRAHEVLHPGTGKGHCDSVSALSNLLSESECESIAQESERLAVAPMDVKCIRGTRRYQRVIVQDEELAKHLWTRAKPAVQAALAGQSLRPLGFGCVQGDWELEGLNPCFRVNSYGAGGCLKPHRDAPFSPEANVRSLCTLLIPLSSVGRTRFFHPVQDKDFRGMTLKEELEARGGLDTGFQALDVCLTAGCGLLFGQSLLHEGIPAEGSQQKMLLRTDVLVRRRPPIPGVLLTEVERKDQVLALQWFREAQHRDLKEEPSNDFYERALSYRYFHPSPEDAKDSWDALKATHGCPETHAKPLWDDPEPLLPNPLLEKFPRFALPSLAFLKGPVAAFRLDPEKSEKPAPQSEGYRDSTSGAEWGPSTAKHLRASAMYALHLLGHQGYGEEMYTVDFDPKTQQVTALPLVELLHAAFEGRPCHGAAYNVAPSRGSPEKDFEAAVDRTHMALRHSCVHIGQDLLAGFKSEAYSNSDLREAGEDFELIDFNQRIWNEYKEAFNDQPREKQFEMSRARPEADWQKYLSSLLAEKAGVPGLDLIALADGNSVLLEDFTGPPVERTDHISVKAWPMNHLVFDFNKHQLVVRAAQATPPNAFYDSEALWLELLQQWRSAGQSDCAFTLPIRCEQSGILADMTLIKDTATTLAVILGPEVRDIVFDADRQAHLWRGAHILPRASLEVIDGRLQFLDRYGIMNCYEIWIAAYEAELESFLASPGHAFERYEVSLTELARPGTAFHHAGEMNGIDWTLQHGLGVMVLRVVEGWRLTMCSIFSWDLPALGLQAR